MSLVNSKQLGIVIILLTSIIWAIEPILAKFSYKNSDFVHTSAIQAMIAALTAFVYIALKRNSSLKITKQQLSLIIYIALVGTLVADFMYFVALSQIPVVNAVIIGHMQPIFIIIFGFFLLKTEALTNVDYLGIALMIFSGLLVTTKTLDNLITLRFGTLGDLIVFVATIAWATSVIVMKKYLIIINASVITFYRFFFPSIIFAAYICVTFSLFVVNVYQVCIGIIIGIGTILYYEELKRLKTVQVSALELSTPFFAVVLAFLFFQ